MDVLSNYFGGTLWGIMIVVGPLILLAGIGYATMMNRRRTRRDEEITRRGTRELYREVEREDQSPRH